MDRSTLNTKLRVSYVYFAGAGGLWREIFVFEIGRKTLGCVKVSAPVGLKFVSSFNLLGA